MHRQAPAGRASLLLVLVFDIAVLSRVKLAQPRLGSQTKKARRMAELGTSREEVSFAFGLAAATDA